MADVTAPYTPGVYDGGPIENYLFQELQRISEIVTPIADGAMDKRHVIPEKPRSGLFIADGADWNPGSGAGLYRYDEDSSSFVAIESGSAPVDSVFGRTGAVTALQADYDGFFLTPGEGDAAYSALGHTHGAFDRASAVLSGANVFSNIVVADGITTAIATRALTAADIGAQAAGTYVNTFAGRSGTVSPLLADYDGFFLTPTEGNAAYSLLGHTHTGSTISALDAGDTTTGVFADVRIPSLNASKITAGIFAAARVATHTGHVTGQTALLLQVAAITGQTALTSGLATTDELLVSDGGVIKRMDMSVVEAFIEGRPMDFTNTIRRSGRGIAYWNTSGQTIARMTISTSAASGGANGDIHFRYT